MNHTQPISTPRGRGHLHACMRHVMRQGPRADGEDTVSKPDLGSPSWAAPLPGPTDARPAWRPDPLCPSPKSPVRTPPTTSPPQAGVFVSLLEFRMILGPSAACRPVPAEGGPIPSAWTLLGWRSGHSPGSPGMGGPRDRAPVPTGFLGGHGHGRAGPLDAAVNG